MTLHHKINVRRLLNIIGGLLGIEAVFICFPVIIAFCGNGPDKWVLLATAVLTAIVSLSLLSIKATSTRMGKREGYLLTASVWVIFSVFGALPFVFGTPGLCFSRAFFEAMSGFTTTGTSAIPPETAIGPGLIMWQALMQWLGGMGIIIFTLAIIPALNTSGGMLMYNAESTGIVHDKLRPRISQTARTLWGTYLGLTIILFCLLWAGPLDWFDSLCYTFGTISTGGFSPTGSSPTLLGSTYITIVITAFMFLGGVSISMIYRSLTGSVNSVIKSETFRLYVIMIAGFSVIFIIAALLTGPFSASESIMDPIFQVVSVITSTGYCASRFPYGLSWIMALTLIMMFTGPCAGSTGGGVKLDRVIVAVRSLADELKRVVRPNAVATVRVGQKVISQNLVGRTVSFLCLFIMMTFLGGVALTFFGLPLESAMVASLSCICNTGFAPEIAGFSGEFFHMADGALWVLSFLMAAGRLEIFTVLLLLTRSFWR